MVVELTDQNLHLDVVVLLQPVCCRVKCKRLQTFGDICVSQFPNSTLHTNTRRVINPRIESYLVHDFRRTSPSSPRDPTPCPPLGCQRREKPVQARPAGAELGINVSQPERIGILRRRSPGLSTRASDHTAHPHGPFHKYRICQQTH